MEKLHTYEASEASGPPPAERDEPMLPRRPRRLEEAEMDMTPMIDITFLLLIFFLVASKMNEPGDVALPKAKFGKPVAVGDAVILTVKDDGPEGVANIYKGDASGAANKLEATDPQDQEDEIVAYVEDELVREAKHHVLIKAARTVKARDVARVAEAVGKAESVQTLHVAVLEDG
jgi:biopolymer transport protein ExbD